MYDEIIRNLREIASIPAHCENVESCDGCSKEDICLSFTNERIIETATKAADAIEERCQQVDKFAEEAARLYAKQPKWIPVTERLPESGVHVLAACRVKWLGGGGRSYVCDAFHTAPKTEVCNYSDDIDMEYDEETDEDYMPEGWWEVIKNWDDYSCVAIGDFVTHWMPLPTPPMEG